MNFFFCLLLCIFSASWRFHRNTAIAARCNIMGGKRFSTWILATFIQISSGQHWSTDFVHPQNRTARNGYVLTAKRQETHKEFIKCIAKESSGLGSPQSWQPCCHDHRNATIVESKLEQYRHSFGTIVHILCFTKNTRTFRIRVAHITWCTGVLADMVRRCISFG